MAIADALTAELEQEVATTRRVLERVPADKLSWKPHEKSMLLGQLAQHVASIPGDIPGLAVPNPAAFPESFRQEPASSVEQLLLALDDSVSKAKEIVRGFDDAAMMEGWSIAAGDKTLVCTACASSLSKDS